MIVSRSRVKLLRNIVLVLAVYSTIHLGHYWSSTRHASRVENRWNVEEIHRLLVKYSHVWPQESTVTRTSRSDNRNCTPHQNIVLLKTHKTGSSTLQNILYRFGDKRDLTFALPTSDNYFGSPFYFRRSYIMRLENVTQYNILANHARYRKSAFEEVMPNDSVYITSVRHPASQFESLYKYYKFSDRFHQPLETFARSPGWYYEQRIRANGKIRRRQAGVNPMLFDLGLHHNDLQNTYKIREQIRVIDRHFDLVLVAEYFEESLILLKDLLCWNMEDIVYLRLNARVDSEVQELSEEAKRNLTVWNSGDMELYEHFNRTLWKKLREYGLPRLRAEIGRLHEHMEKLKERCLDGDTELFFPGNRTAIQKFGVKGYLSDTQRYFCKSFTRRPQEYMQILKRKMRGKSVDEIS